MTVTAEEVYSELVKQGKLLEEISRKLDVLEANGQVVTEAYSALTQRMSALEVRCMRNHVRDTPNPYGGDGRDDHKG